MSIKLILLLMLSIQINGDIVDWNPGSYFDTPTLFEGNHTTCSKTTVDFPEILRSTVLLKGEHSVNSITFPLYGEIVLDEAVIYFGDDKDDVNCTEEVTRYIERKTYAWNEADVWSSKRFNKATPDAEKMPCSYDTVRFADNHLTTIELPEKVQYVEYVLYDNQKFNDGINFLLDVYDSITQVYRLILNSGENLGVEITATSCKPLECVCQENQLDVNCSSKHCPRLLCDNAIQPIGDCCQICGSSTVIEIEPNYNVTQITELVEEIIDSYSEDLVYHIGRISKDKVQIVIVDRYDYTSATAEVANEIAYKMKGMLHVNGVSALSSGIPLTQRGLGAKISFSMLFIVTLVMGAIYLFYYKMPPISFPSFVNRHLARNIGVTRFQRRTESVVTLVRRDSTVSPAPIDTQFNNPLYDSKRD